MPCPSTIDLNCFLSSSISSMLFILSISMCYYASLIVSLTSRRSLANLDIANSLPSSSYFLYLFTVLSFSSSYALISDLSLLTIFSFSVLSSITFSCFFFSFSISSSCSVIIYLICFICSGVQLLSSSSLEDAEPSSLLFFVSLSYSSSF